MIFAREKKKQKTIEEIRKCFADDHNIFVGYTVGRRCEA